MKRRTLSTARQHPTKRRRANTTTLVYFGINHSFVNRNGHLQFVPAPLKLAGAVLYKYTTIIISVVPVMRNYHMITIHIITS